MPGGADLRAIFLTPTYNEAENLPELAARLLALEPAVDVLCVDDASPDGTGRIADGIAASEPRFHVLHRAGSRGYARASRDGLSWCLAHDYDIIGTLDADLSHDPAVVPRLLEAVADGADLAIGSRYVPGGELVVDWGRFREAVSKAGNVWARAMISTRTRDCTSGFRCYRAETLARLPFASLTSDGYCFLMEVLAEMVDAGGCVVEEPIRFVDRRAGSSKISKAIIAEALWRTTQLGASRVFGERRRVRRSGGIASDS
jgi:dolichol-phosphate mannosyltransferase